MRALLGLPCGAVIQADVNQTCLQRAERRRPFPQVCAVKTKGLKFSKLFILTQHHTDSVGTVLTGQRSKNYFKYNFYNVILSNLIYYI